MTCPLVMPIADKDNLMDLLLKIFRALLQFGFRAFIPWLLRRSDRLGRRLRDFLNRTAFYPRLVAAIREALPVTAAMAVVIAIIALVFWDFTTPPKPASPHGTTSYQECPAGCPVIVAPTGDGPETPAPPSP